MRKIALLVGLMALVASSVASAAPVQWTVASGGNGHWYEYFGDPISAPNDWADQQAKAVALGGYLVTITSEAENRFISTALGVGSLGGCTCVWLGGFQNLDSPSYSEPSGGWEWVTGEPWAYTNWAGGEPNNSGAGQAEDHLTSWFSPDPTNITWNDHYPNGSGRYLVEWDTNPSVMTKTIDFEDMTVGSFPTSEAPMDIGDGFYAFSHSEFAGDSRYTVSVYETGLANGRALRDTGAASFGAGLGICRYDEAPFRITSVDAGDFEPGADSREPLVYGSVGGYDYAGTVYPRYLVASLDAPEGEFATFPIQANSEVCWALSVMDLSTYDESVDNIVVEWDVATCTAPGDFAPSTATLAAFQDNHCEDWTGVSQPGEDLQSAILSMAKLDSANLPGALLFNVDFSGASLIGASLVNTQVGGADFTGTDLTFADLSFATMTGAIYDETTIFPSGNTYDIPPWGLYGDSPPWDEGMIPVPEPTMGSMLVFGVGGLLALAGRRRKATSRRH